MIFETGERTDWDIKHYLDSNYSFLNKSAWPMCDFARDFINQWAALFPADTEFIARVKSKDDNQHNAALFELLFYAVAVKHCLVISRNPAGSKKTPDFSITLNEKTTVLAECTLAASAMETIQDRRKIASVVQMIEDFRDCPYHISIEFLPVSKNS